jgi:hypothetical protein
MKKSRKDIEALIDTHKRKPCTDCGKRYPPVCMDFDHLPQFKKEFNISQSGAYKLEAISAEISKCEVVCSNCHRLRTQKRHQERTWNNATAMHEELRKLNDAGPSVVAGYVKEDEPDEDDDSAGVEELRF